MEGGQDSEQVTYDAKRSVWLEAQGFRVLRSWNHEVLKEIDVVKEVKVEALGCGFNTPTLILPRKGGGKYDK